MDNKIREALENLEHSSPLESTKILQEMEMYDEKSSQEIIDEVYEQFESGENMKTEILTPVFMAVVDGLLEATSSGRAARKKGLTASRVLQDCEQFSYDGELDNATNVNAYTEYKNAREFNDVNSNMTQEYNGENRRKLYEDKSVMEQYKMNRVVGEKSLTDEYTGKRNLYHKQDNPDKRYNDETHRKQAQPDHIVPLKQVHEKFKSNYALDDSDIKKIANIEGNFAVTSAEINQVKKEMSNQQYIDWMDAHGKPVDEQTKKNMLQLQKNAEKSVNAEANEIIAKNLVGKGEVNGETMKVAVERFKEENNGKSPTSEEKQKIENELIKEKTSEIHETAVTNAISQAKDYAVGNLILFIVKPIYYEMSDIFKNGLQAGVGASSGVEAITIRFGRVKRHVLAHGKEFLGDNMWEFVKGFVSSLVEGIISLFVGVLKQILKVIKEGIKIFVQSAKILFGKESKEMSPEEKGDAIIKLIGGSVIAISGIAIEALLNRINIGEPWSVVLSTMLSGIASALFMYILDKADIFSVKAQKRHDRISEIFEERISDINDAAENCNIIAIETLTRQKKEFEIIFDGILDGLKANNILEINDGLYKIANFMNIDLSYSNTDEFCDYMDSEEILCL